LGSGIITTAILLIVGYIIITKVIGLAFRLIVPVVLLVLFAGAGIFTDLLPGNDQNHHSADNYQPYDQDRRIPNSVNRLGDMSLRDIADAAVGAARSFLRNTLALLDRAADPEPPSQLPPYSASRDPSRDRFGEHQRPSYDESPSENSEPRPWRAY
jgi:hypothetical protein